MILAIETSSNICSVAIFDEQTTIACTQINSKNTHDKLLANMCKNLFDNLMVNINLIDYISVNIGPGSFTGLRIGLSFVKGLIFGKNIKLIDLCSNDILYSSLNREMLDHNIIKAVAIIDAGNENYYLKSYNLATNEVSEDLHIVHKGNLKNYTNEYTVLISNSAIDDLGNTLCLKTDLNAGLQASLAYKVIQKQNFKDIKGIKPLYLNDIDYKIKK